MGEIDFYNPKYYTNREFSWILFDHRVLNEARDKNIPLYERLKFLSITASNLDEFFMVRIASLRDMVTAKYLKPDIAGMTPKEQLEHTHQHHQGDEVGGGENGLEELFRLFPRQGVEHQGDDDGQREADDKAQYAQQEGVFHQRPELDVGKEADEVVKANPDCGV